MRYCNADRRCRDLSIGPDGVKHPAAIDTEVGLCDECTAHIQRRCIDAWLDDFDALRIMLGERQSSSADRVAYTPSPTIPLSLDPEKLMVDLVFHAGLAADMVSDSLKIASRPYKGRGHPLRHRAELAAAMGRVSPHLPKLLTIGSQPVMVWATGEAVDQTPTRWERTGPRTYIPVDDHGRQIVGKGRVLIELSGVDVALKLRDLHELVRGYYGARGKDRADHMQMPCHKCGSRSLYRDHGTDLIRCRKCPPHTEGDRGWTQDQYDRLAGLTRFHLKVQEEKDMELLKWLVAERDWEKACGAWVAAERLYHLGRAATVAGFDDVDGLIAALDAVAA